jgi:hypothetical protein
MNIVAATRTDQPQPIEIRSVALDPALKAEIASQFGRPEGWYLIEYHLTQKSLDEHLTRVEERKQHLRAVAEGKAKALWTDDLEPVPPSIYVGFTSAHFAGLYNPSRPRTKGQDFVELNSEIPEGTGGLCAVRAERMEDLCSMSFIDHARTKILAKGKLAWDRVQQEGKDKLVADAISAAVPFLR